MFRRRFTLLHLKSFFILLNPANPNSKNKKKQQRSEERRRHCNTKLM
jgi:hypothetical protein